MAVTKTNVISLEDHQLMLNVIDICSQRGAFKGDELALIGNLRNNIANYILQNTPTNTTES